MSFALGHDVILLEPVERFSGVGQMSPRVESFDTMAEGVALLHRVPISHELVVCLQTFIETSLAREVALASIMINETCLLEIVVVNILRAQAKFQV
jgi:hypothetical protein